MKLSQKLAHRLFGWDYIYWSGYCIGGFARVQRAPDGTVWFHQSKYLGIVKVITDPRHVVWMTCLPSKYFPCDIRNFPTVIDHDAA